MDASTLFIDPTAQKVGVGTNAPQKTFHIQGDMLLTGSIYDSTGEPFSLAGGASWRTPTSAPTLQTPTGVVITVTSNVALQRYSANDMTWNLQTTFLISQNTANAGAADFVLRIPIALDNSAYAYSTTVGDLWLTATDTGASGIQSSFKAIARTIPGNKDTLLIRYLTGTTDVSLVSIPAGYRVTLGGYVMYQTEVFVRNPPQDSIYIPGTGVQWISTTFPHPQLVAPTGASVSVTSNMGSLRYIGDDLVYNMYVEATLGAPPSVPSAAYKISLQYPLRTDFYANQAILGDLWLNVTNSGAGTSTMYKGIARASDSNYASISYLNGTYELGLGTIDSGSTIQIQGNIIYKTTTQATIAIPSEYLPNAFTQDVDGNVAINNGGVPARAQMDIVHYSNLPVMVLDQRGTNGNILEVRKNGSSLKVSVDANGNVFSAGTITASNVRVVGDIIEIQAISSNSEQIVVENAGTGPALKVTQTGAEAIAEFYDDGGVLALKVADGGNVGIGTAVPSERLQVEGNVMTSGTVSGGTGLMFRNRIINGDMRIDQRNNGSGVGGLTGNFITYKVNPTVFYTVDRFAIAAPNIGGLIAKQVSLSSADQAATEGFTNAVEIGLVPKDGLDAYFMFDGNLTDASGNGVVLTSTGTIQYGPGVIGSGSLYLANEANVTAATLAAKFLTSAYAFPVAFTVCMWINTFSSSTRACQVFITNSGFGSDTYLSSSIFLGTIIVSSVNKLQAGFYGGNTVAMSETWSTNTWYHVSITYSSGTLTLYVNGTSKGSCAGTLAQNGFKLGDSGNTAYPQPFAGLIDDFRIYNRILSATEIAALATNVGVPEAPLTTLASGLVSLLAFDNSTSDAQGTLSAPTVTGTAVFTPMSKVGTYALDLTGNTAGGQSTSTATNALTYNTVTNYAFPITLAGWINGTAVATIQVVLCIGNNSGANIAYLQAYIDVNGKFIFSVVNAGTGYACATSFAAVAGTWYHIAVTATAPGYLNGYVNGVLCASIALPSGYLGAPSNSVNQLRIGAQTGTNIGYAFKGFIDDVRVYNRVLSSAEVAGLYAASFSASFSLFQQIIEGTNMYDFAWGLPQARPLTASMWVKNNTASDQQLSISVNNSTGLLAWMDFENSSFADKLGFLTNATAPVTTTFSTSTYKIGSASLDLTANTMSGTPTNRVIYNTPYSIQLPLTFSLWIYLTASVTNFVNVFSLGSSTSGTNVVQMFLNASSQLYVDIYNNNGSYGIGASASTAVAANRWYHVVLVVEARAISQLYMNGVRVSVSATNYPSDPPFLAAVGNATNQFNLGLQTGINNWAFKGYMDDVRIYNSVLSATQVLQLYRNNASSTVASKYLVPRSWVYPTPVIPSSSWKKVTFTVSGDTTGSWMNDTNAGLTVSVCLGATSLYGTNSTSTWIDAIDYMAGNSQRYSYGSSNVLSKIVNSMYITGVQIEKGSLATPFEFRPYTLELQLCQRYLETVYAYAMGTGGASYIGGCVNFATVKRVAPVMSILTTIRAQNVTNRYLEDITIYGCGLTVSTAAGNTSLVYSMHTASANAEFSTN